MQFLQMYDRQPKGYILRAQKKTTKGNNTSLGSGTADAALHAMVKTTLLFCFEWKKLGCFLMMIKTIKGRIHPF